MNRATRDKFVAGTGADLTAGNSCWETPPAIFAKLAADFGPFDVDLTADADRHLCSVWFGPGGLRTDALAAPSEAATWALYGTKGYSNPPYGPFVPRLLETAKREAREFRFTSVLLLPLRVTRAFRASVLNGAADLLFCDKRITFWEHGAPRVSPDGRTAPALFDSIIVIYRPGLWHAPGLGVWQVPPHVTPADVARAIARREVP